MVCSSAARYQSPVPTNTLGLVQYIPAQNINDLLDAVEIVRGQLKQRSYVLLLMRKAAQKAGEIINIKNLHIIFLEISLRLI